MPLRLCLVGAGHMGRIHARKLAGVGTPEPNSDRAAFGAITSAGSARELFDANT